MKQHKICRKITFSWELREKQQTLLDKVHCAAIAMEMKIYLSFSLLRDKSSRRCQFPARQHLLAAGEFLNCACGPLTPCHISSGKFELVCGQFVKLQNFLNLRISHPSLSYLLYSQQCNVSQKLCKFYFATKVQAGSISPLGPFQLCNPIILAILYKLAQTCSTKVANLFENLIYRVVQLSNRANHFAESCVGLFGESFKKLIK